MIVVVNGGGLLRLYCVFSYGAAGDGGSGASQRWWTVGVLNSVHSYFAGVIGLCALDLYNRGIVGDLAIVDAVGVRLPEIKANMQEKIGKTYKGMDAALGSIRWYPGKKCCVLWDVCVCDVCV